MADKIIKELEFIFRTSASSEELFDAFRKAIGLNISDPGLYEALLWNKSLSTDEIIMFAEKLCTAFPNISYDIYMWLGKIFESLSTIIEHHDSAFKYYFKASKLKPAAHEPLISIAEIYNPEYDIPQLKSVVESTILSLSKLTYLMNLQHTLASRSNRHADWCFLARG